jgi:hypothetical protein
LTFLDWASLDASLGTIGLEQINAGLEPGEIAEHFMTNAIKLMRDYFWLHGRAALRQIGRTDRHGHMRRTLRWIRAHQMPVVSVRDIRREALGHCLDAEQTHDLLGRMAAAGWLRLEKTDTGGRPLERWQVNPKLFETESAESAQTAESPQRVFK